MRECDRAIAKAWPALKKRLGADASEPPPKSVDRLNELFSVFARTEAAAGRPVVAGTPIFSMRTLLSQRDELETANSGPHEPVQ